MPNTSLLCLRYIEPPKSFVTFGLDGTPTLVPTTFGQKTISTTKRTFQFMQRSTKLDLIMKDDYKKFSMVSIKTFFYVRIDGQWR